MKNDLIDSFKGAGNSFLSNFYLCEVEYKGVIYPSSEHAYQAAKMKNIEDRNKVANAETPAKAKKLAKNLPMADRFENQKIGIMREIVFNKFNQNHELSAMLLATENKRLIEGNPWGDTFWGVCKGVGENNLGEILMAVREELRS